MANSSLPIAGGHRSGLGSTMRTDRWWIGPMLTFLGLSAFIVYATWAALHGEHYYYGPYLSPFYSPVLFQTWRRWVRLHLSIPGLENGHPGGQSSFLHRQHS